MKKRSRFLILIPPCLIFPISLTGQFSLKPSPLPDCKTFLLTEIGYYYRVSSFPEELSFYEHHSYFTSNVGLMMNLSSKFSIGAANFIGLDDDGQLRWGVKARARRWFGPEKSAELSLGLNFADTRDYYDKPAFTGELSLSLRDLFIFNILVEVASYKAYEYADYEPYELLGIKEGSDVAIYTGFKTGRKVGLIANIGIGAVFIGFIVYGLIVGGD